MFLDERVYEAALAHFEVCVVVVLSGLCVLRDVQSLAHPCRRAPALNTTLRYCDTRDLLPLYAFAVVLHVSSLTGDTQLCKMRPAQRIGYHTSQ